MRGRCGMRCSSVSGRPVTDRRRILLRILPCPFPCGLIMLLSIIQILLRNTMYQWILRVCIGEHGADGQEHLRCRQGRTPIILQYIQADRSGTIDITMVDTSTKCHAGWLEWIILREADVEEEDTTGIGRTLRTHDGCEPFIYIVIFRSR